MKQTQSLVLFLSVAVVSLFGCFEDEADENPAIVTTAPCGSVSASPQAVSTDVTDPTPFAIGELVGGRLEEDTAHYWVVDVTPGLYHIVLDSARVDGADRNVGVHLRDGDTVSGARIFFVNEIAPDLRASAFLEVDTEGELLLSLEPLFTDEDYQMMLVENGEPVPSPRFTACPSILPLEAPSATTIQLAEDGEEGERQWYSLSLPAGTFDVTVNAARADGESNNIIVALNAVYGFGETSGIERVVRASEVDSAITLSGEIVTTEPTDLFLVLDNGHDPLDVEFEITPR